MIAAAPYEIPDGPAVDLKVESQIPSKIRRPGNDQMPTGLSARAPHRERTNENENENESAEVAN